MLPSKSFYITVVLVLPLINPDILGKIVNNTREDASNIWLDVGKMTGTLLHNCLRLGSTKSSKQFLKVQDCLKRRSLLVFDRTLNRDIIKLAEGIALVRYHRDNNTRYNRALKIFDNPKFEEKYKNWKSQIVERLDLLFRTHVLKIRLRTIDGAQVEARGRHKHGMMSQLMMFAVIAAGLIVIPMGFQFLAILGGKALLLAKMALLMTSIQGLKKIATSNVNYGLYSTHGQGPWHYDRQWPYYDDNNYGGDPSYNNYYSNNQHHADLLHPRHDYLDE